MFKAVLLATSMLVAAPVFAQDRQVAESTQTQPQNPPATQPSAPQPGTTDDAAPGTQGSGTVEEAPAATPAPATEAAQPTPSQPATPAQPDAAQPQPATPAQPAATPQRNAAAGTTGAGSAATQPASTPAQVAEAVGRDFGSYDKDSSGTLTQAEFGAWVGALRKASEPGFAPGSPEANVWLGQAFAQADADKNKSVSQAEVTAFLTPKK